MTEIVTTLAPPFPHVAGRLADAAEHLLAFTHFPLAQWRELWSTNPLERINGEIKRRTNVVVAASHRPLSRRGPPGGEP